MKQGVRCKVCKVAVHHKCQENLPLCNLLAQELAKSGKASSKKIFRRQNSVQDIRVSLSDKRKFLRRQKSSSALEIPEDTLRERERDEGDRPSVTVDPIYETIKCAASLSSLSHTLPPESSRPAPSRLERRASVTPKDEETEDFFLCPADNTSLSKSAPHSPSHSDERRRILQQCGKSTSLDNEKGSREDERRLITSSVAVTSSTDSSKPRLSTHQFVVLYDFEGMLRDDLTLRTGRILRVLNGKNAEWWKGEVDGRVGYFPSFCVTPIYANESVMRVSTGIRAAQEHIDGINLRKHQIVVKSGNDDGEWVKVRTALKSGFYPLSYLQTLLSQQS